MESLSFWAADLDPTEEMYYFIKNNLAYCYKFCEPEGNNNEIKQQSEA